RGGRIVIVITLVDATEIAARAASGALRVDAARLRELRRGWYFPYQPPAEPMAGSQGIIRNQENRAHFVLGSAFSLERDLAAYDDILVDTGESATRAGCGAPCKAASQHLVEQLTADLGGAQLAMVWITHQHSDHLGRSSACSGTVLSVR